jgi:hypothetical protein
MVLTCELYASLFQIHDFGCCLKLPLDP